MARRVAADRLPTTPGRRDHRLARNFGMAPDGLLRSRVDELRRELDNRLNVAAIVHPPIARWRPSARTGLQRHSSQIPQTPNASGANPLVDISGAVAGPNTLIIRNSGGSEGLDFAIPAHGPQRQCSTELIAMPTRCDNSAAHALFGGR